MDEFHGRDLIHNYVFDINSDFYKKHHVMIINPLGAIRIQGITGENAINLGFQSNFGGNPIADAVGSAIASTVDTASSDLNKAANKKLQAMGSALGAAGRGFDLVKQAKGYGTQTLESTYSLFESAATVPLTIDLFIMKEFIPSKNYVDIVKDSLRLTTPESFEKGTGLIKAPLGYSPYSVTADGGISGVSEGNTCTIICGDQLKITHMLCENFSYTPSVQLREDGSPVYIKCTYSFKTGRVLSCDEYFNWFTKL